MAESNGEAPIKDLHARLGAHRLEIEQAILARICAFANPADAENGDYAAGLKSAISAGVSHGLAGVRLGEDRAGPVPAALRSQARQAARHGVSLDVLLHRYFAGYMLFGDFVMREIADRLSPRGATLRRMQHAQAVLFERVVLAVLDEYTHTNADHQPGPRQRQVDQVKKLLAGEPADIATLSYELDDWHVGAAAEGSGAAAVLRDVAEAVDRRLLLIQPEQGTVWAWFGGRRKVAVAELAQQTVLSEAPDALIALGEPARGLEGWRLTHRQASAALRIAGQGKESVVRYADVGLLASISRDRLLASSLRQLYLAPLADARDGGIELRKTLRAYFSTGRNVSSAASVLGVSRQTVGNRLRLIEEKLGRTLESCAPEVEIALRLEGGLSGRSNS